MGLFNSGEIKTKFAYFAPALGLPAHYKSYTTIGFTTISRESNFTLQELLSQSHEDCFLDRL